MAGIDNHAERRPDCYCEAISLVCTDSCGVTIPASAGYELHVVHVQPVHKNMMNHADEDYREAGVKAPDTKQHEANATDMVGKLTRLWLQLSPIL